MARKKLRRRLAHGGAVGAGFLVRTALVGAAARWLLDRERGAERRRRVLGWARSLLGRARQGAVRARPAEGGGERAGVEGG